MNESHLKVVQVCLEYAPSSGGDIATVMDFNRVFETSIIAFTSADNMVQDQGRNQNVFRVPIRSGIPGRCYSWPVFSNDLHKAEQILRQASLVIFHLLYRYHIQWAGAIARKVRIPYWIIPHGGLDPYVFTYRSMQKRIWLSTVGYPIMRCAQSVLFATKREREKALPHIQGCRTNVVHWPVQHVDTSPRAEVRAFVRRQHHIPDEARVLLWIGRLHAIKRPFQTIETFGQIGNPDVHLMLVGPDDAITGQDCERFCADRGIKNVHVVGPVYGDKKYEYYMAADTYVSLSYKENFSYTAAEALASGLPVILSPGNDLSAELQDLNCGWMLKTDDAREVITVFQQFASIPQSELDKMGFNGQSWVRTTLSPATFSQTVRQLAEEATVEAH